MNKDELKSCLKDENIDDSQKIKYRGELISLLKKEIKNEKDVCKKQDLKIELLTELNKHKNVLAESKKDSTKSYNIPQRVGLAVKDIAASIDIFMEKNDIISKLKKALISTGASTVVIGGIATAVAACTGTLSMATMAALVPTISYIGLSNILKSGLKDTNFSKKIKQLDKQDELTEEMKAFIEQNITNNNDLIELLKEKVNSDIKRERLIEIDEKLVELYKKIIAKAPIDSVKNAIIVELINLLKELKQLYEKQKKDYIKDKITMSVSDFALLEKKSLDIDVSLFNEENFLKSASKNAFHNISINTVTMYLSRLILSAFFPTLKFDSLKDAITPFILTVVNNLSNLGEFKKKINLKDTKYIEKQISFNNPELFNEICQSNSLAIA